MRSACRRSSRAARLCPRAARARLLLGELADPKAELSNRCAGLARQLGLRGWGSVRELAGALGVPRRARARAVRVVARSSPRLAPPCGRWSACWQIRASRARGARIWPSAPHQRLHERGPGGDLIRPADRDRQPQAREARTGRAPATGELITIVAQPASVDVRARPLARPKLAARRARAQSRRTSLASSAQTLSRVELALIQRGMAAASRIAACRGGSLGRVAAWAGGVASRSTQHMSSGNGTRRPRSLRSGSYGEL